MSDVRPENCDPEFLAESALKLAAALLSAGDTPNRQAAVQTDTGNEIPR
jgi:hypothetical protein